MCKSEIISIIASGLLIVSEVLPEIKKVEGNSIFRVIWRLIWH